ncbi:MAG TPA: aminotransferase class III-fold pyridoxal phosphate-dependent enzyme, partial [Leptospiraceae bacterium]|nr:aminotransferase class III-fold pyridoxal phosphate-dependent enzyme [Leptospiraceae bacterium]
MNQTADILNWHAKHAWQPFTQMKLSAPPVIIDRAEGLYLIASDGRKIIDAVGSWWVSIHGHNHPDIVNAVQKQLNALDQVMYAGFTHEPAARLSHRLSEKTNGHLPRAFYSDNGACAVEIGLKMAFQYFVNCGRPEKSKFITLENGYHGDTIGTMSAGARSVFHKMYEPLLFPVFTAKG